MTRDQVDEALARISAGLERAAELADDGTLAGRWRADAFIELADLADHLADSLYEAAAA